MTYIYPFLSQLPSSSADLPATLISLEEWALINVEGPDSRQYLQGQLTCDVNTLTDSHFIQAAHCEAKGKVWSNMSLFGRGEKLCYIERTSVAPQQVNELKKYAVFSKLTIAPATDRVLLGLAGQEARQTLQQIYAELPDQQTNIVYHNDTTLLYLPLPTERFIIVTTPSEAQHLFDSLLGKVALNDSKQWLALDIEAGLAVIDLPNSAQFLPQSLNLQALDAISFTKGCYTGQEMVARAKYRGANKRALYWLSGTSHQPPTVGEELELNLGDNWRKTGTILATVTLSDGSLWIQAILSNDLAPDTLLRVKEDAISQLTIQPLPYSLSE